MESRKGNVICHPCAYGVFCASVGISKEDALLNYLYAQTSAMVTNCVKSIPLSQSDGQKMLVSFYTVFQEVLDTVKKSGEEMLCLSTPGFDIRSIQHERLYSEFICHNKLPCSLFGRHHDRKIERTIKVMVKIGVAGPVGSGKNSFN